MSVSIHRLRYCVLGAMFAFLPIGIGPGCDATTHNRAPISDNSILVVEPGKGIPDVCELGMSFEQIRAVASDATTLKMIGSRERYLFVPSLGVTGIPGRQGKIGLLTFHTQQYDSRSTVPGMLVTNTFRGRIGSWLSFSNHTVNRKEVEAAFGPVQQYVTNANQFFYPKGKPEADKMQPFSFRDKSLYYPAIGLEFRFREDAVTEVAIWDPHGIK